MHQLPSFLLMCNAGMKVYTVLSYSSWCKEGARGSTACVSISKSSNNTEKQASSLTFMSCQMFYFYFMSFLNLQRGCCLWEWYLENRLTVFDVIRYLLAFPVVRGWIEVCHCSQIYEMSSALLSVVCPLLCSLHMCLTGSTSLSQAENRSPAEGVCGVLATYAQLLLLVGGGDLLLDDESQACQWWPWVAPMEMSVWIMSATSPRSPETLFVRILRLAALCLGQRKAIALIHSKGN